MNICFYTTFEVSPMQGGTERITFTVAKNLCELYGWKCYNIYLEKARTEFVPEVFDDIKQVEYPGKNRDQILEILRNWKVDVLINQGAFDLSPIFSDILNCIDAKYIFCHHFEPGFEQSFFSLRTVAKNWRKYRDLKQFLKMVLYPYLKLCYIWSLHRDYRMTYQLADRVVLLSEYFIPQFMSYGSIGDNKKFGIIHNSLSFDSFLDAANLGKKEKNVLIVSRMEDTPKKISYALRIWKEVEQSDSYKEWHLYILGKGADLESYKRYVLKHRLSRVSFEGMQPPEDYYRRASIFLMTSSSEGWGLTLTEAQQFGCVPLAFDTYASLHEIIKDGYNGFIIPKNDFPSYIGRLEQLMCDSELMHQMAVSAIASSHRFEQKTIAQQWYDLLLDVCGSENR